MAIQSVTLGAREVFVGSFIDAAAARISSPFAALVSASCQEERNEVLSIAGGLLEQGCKEFCCVGLEAELLHDQLDVLLEEAGSLDVVTTWHEDAVDGCEYFLFAAGGQRLLLFALISQHPELLDVLASTAQAD